MTEGEAGLMSQYFYQPLHYPHSPCKVVPHHRGVRPLLFTNVSVGSFISQKKHNSGRVVRWSLCFFPHPRRLDCLTICRCHNKGSTFSSVIQRPRVSVQPGFIPATSCEADWHLSNRPLSVYKNSA